MRVADDVFGVNLPNPPYSWVGEQELRLNREHWSIEKETPAHTFWFYKYGNQTWYDREDK